MQFTQKKIKKLILIKTALIINIIIIVLNLDTVKSYLRLQSVHLLLMHVSPLSLTFLYYTKLYENRQASS